MIVVLDANVLFSALITDGKTAELLFEESLELYATDFIIEEYLKYQETIQTKTKRKNESLIGIMFLLKEIVTIIPKEEYQQYMEQATEISPDEKDIMYFALALKLQCPIWSNDKKLKQQNKVRVYSTEEIQTIISSSASLK